MSLAVRSTSTAAAQTGATFSVTKPTGTVDGDWLVAFQTAVLSGGTSPTGPSGWTRTSDINMGGFQRLLAYTKAASSEPASWTFNNASGGVSPESSVYCFAISGTPSGVDGSAGTSGVSTNAAPGFFETSVADAIMLAAYAIGTNAGDTITPNGVWTAPGTIGGTVEKLATGYRIQATAGGGPLADLNATISTSMRWGALIVAIQPPAATATSSTGTLMGI